MHLLSSIRMELAVLASRPVVGSSRKSTGGSIISSMPIFVLFLSPPETPQIICVPCKTSQSEQPSIHVPHFMNYNTDCSNSSRLPLVDHTDQFHQTQITPFYRGLCGTHRFTYSHQNSFTYRSHQPNDFHADSQSANLLRPTGSRPCWIVWKHDLTTLRMLNCKGVFDISNGLAIVRLQIYGEEGKQEVCYSVFRMRR